MGVSVTFPLPQVDDVDGLSVRVLGTVEPHCEAVGRELGQTGGEISQLTPVTHTVLQPVIHTVELHNPGPSDRVHDYSGNIPE